MNELYYDADNVFCDGTESEIRKIFLCWCGLPQTQVEFSVPFADLRYRLDKQVLCLRWYLVGVDRFQCT